MRNPFKPLIIRNCEGDPYLIRWKLLRTPWFSIYLHHILRREMHDHPWNFMTLIMTGGYTEHTLKGSRFHPSGSLLYRPTPWAHRLELKRPVWTLVFVGPRKREWGFHTQSGWVPWRMFLRAKGCPE